MSFDFQWVEQDVVYRYSRNAGPESEIADGYPNFKFALRPREDHQPTLQLEKGINASREVGGPDGWRRPVVLLRSSPWKAGTETTPWHDDYDLESGRVRYYGDAKPTNSRSANHAGGNKSLLSLSPLFLSTNRAERQFAPPLAVFRGESAEIEGKGLVHKGLVRFVGLGFLVGHTRVRQVDAEGNPFSNVAFDLLLCPLEETGGKVDWGWINDRRDEALPATEANLRAPFAWRRWVETGRLP